MSKYFSNIDIWNPTIMRLNFEIAVAKHNAKFARDESYKIPLDKIFRQITHGYIDGRKMKKYLTPDGDIPTSSEIWRILNCIRTIDDSSAFYAENDLYTLGIFLDEKASIAINDAIDEVKEYAKSFSDGKDEKYYILVYKMLYCMRTQVVLTFQDWYLRGKNKGLRSTNLKNLRIFTVKSLKQSIKDNPEEAWEKMIFKDDDSGLLPKVI